MLTNIVMLPILFYFQQKFEILLFGSEKDREIKENAKNCFWKQQKNRDIDFHWRQSHIIREEKTALQHNLNYYEKLKHRFDINFTFSSLLSPNFSQRSNRGVVHDREMHHIIQIQIPRTIRRVPNKAKPTRVSSPKSMAATAVAANVVALVTGTASDIGVSLKMAKKVADADKFIKKGTEYCHVRRRLSQFLQAASSRWWSGEGLFGGEEEEEDLSFWPQMSAPRRIMALVEPHTKPTAIIFSTSPIIPVLLALIEAATSFGLAF